MTDFATALKVVKAAAGTENTLEALEYTQEHFEELSRGEQVAHRLVFGGFRKLFHG